MWKKLIAMICIAGSLTIVADTHEADHNLLGKRWTIWAKSKGTFIDKRTGEIYCKNVSNKERSGVYQILTLNQKTPISIRISAESRATNIPENYKISSPARYSIYVDCVYMDGSRKFGLVAPFKYSNHDWEKAELLFTPDKPIRSLNIHLLLNETPGEVIFRNIKALSVPE